MKIDFRKTTKMLSQLLYENKTTEDDRQYIISRGNSWVTMFALAGDTFTYSHINVPLSHSHYAIFVTLTLTFE